MEKNQAGLSVSVFTLGCKVNLYESRQIVSQLLQAGYDAFEGLKKADIFVINTCAVTNEAERKSRQAVARCKKLNPSAKVLVCGCASQKDPIQFEHDGVVFVKGAGDTTLPIYIQSAMRRGTPPVLNALSVIFLLLTFGLVFVTQNLLSKGKSE